MVYTDKECRRPKDIVNLISGLVLFTYDIFMVSFFIIRSFKKQQCWRFFGFLINWANLIFLVNVFVGMIYVIVSSSTLLNKDFRFTMSQFMVMTTYSTRCIFIYLAICSHFFDKKLAFVYSYVKMNELPTTAGVIERFIKKTQT